MFSILQKLFSPIWWHCLLIHFHYFIFYVIYFLDTWNQFKQNIPWFLHFKICGSGHKLMSDFSIFWSSKIQRFLVISDDWTFVQTLTKLEDLFPSVEYGTQWRFVYIDVVTLNLSKNSKSQENCLILLSPNEKRRKNWYNFRLDWYKEKFMLIRK